ncbi:hypothetical protein ACKI10_15180 [Streptomyces galilaeus]|uniref:hypothetical protein n=1 Tax=Streptomyces TaxID=1883 RepID=UPI0034DFAB2C
MSAAAWLLAALLVVLVVLVVLAADDSRWTRRRLPPVTQHTRPRPPYVPDAPPPVWQPHFYVIRGRRNRAERARYRYPQEF